MDTPTPAGPYTRLWRRLWRYKGRLLTSVVFSVIIAGLFTGTVGALKPMGDILFEADGLGKLRGMWFFTTAPGGWLKGQLGSVLYNQRDALLFCVAVILAMGTAKNILRYFQEYLAGWVGERVVIDLSNDLYHKVQGFSVGYYTEHGTQDVISRFVQDCYLVGAGIARMFNRAIREPLKAIGALVACFLLNWQLTLLALVVFPLAGMMVARFGQSIKKRVRRILRKRAQVLSSLEENFYGIRVVQAFCLEEHFEGRFRARNDKLFEDARQVVHFDALTAPIMEGMIHIVGAGVILYTGMMVLEAKMTAGAFLMFYAAMAAMFDPVKKLSKLNNKLQTSMAAATRVFEMLDRTPTIADAPGAASLAPLETEIRFEHVHFQYATSRPDAESRAAVLHDIDLQIRRGEMLGIVGKTGSGKSTLASLLPRFFDVTSGRITIDGTDIRTVKLADLRRQIGIVTQDHMLWNQSIAENIRLGRLDATDEQVADAARAAHIDTFIDSLPQGYDTVIGEHGYGLSGGQRQRLAIARAILNNPRILILDEATNALDTESEAKVQAALDAFVKDRTTLVIAHRLSTLQNADRILVLADGKIEAVGTHEELMQSSAVYPALVRQQFAGRKTLAETQ